MCGICGALGVSDTDTLADMAECITHRGPDARGTHVTDDVMLANQRLSIIDLDGGDQPVYNETGDVTVVYNGEIYNFRSLRAGLQRQGHTFTTNTDTEVIVHGYEEYGAGIFDELNGMFAVALWDECDSRLLLGRDRVGIKPLYYAPTDSGLFFASEPKSILQTRHVRPRVDTQALQYFLQLRYTPSHTTLFEGIETLLPGQYLDVRYIDGEVVCQTHEYWNPLAADADSPPNPEAAVEDALRNAVERQLMSDVPVGFYLSGGLDTSSVVAMASEISDEPINTYCMGFDDGDWDERADARAVAEHFGTNHHEISIEQEFMRDFPEMIWYAGEPKRNLYPYYVARAMSDNVRVALGGLGADELFGGYIYRYSRLQELEQLRRTGSTSETAAIGGVTEQVVEWQLRHGDHEEDDTLESLGLLQHLDDPARLYVLLNSTDVFGDIEAIRHRVFGDELAEFVPAKWIRNRLSGLDGKPLTEQSLYHDFTIKLPNDFLLVEDRMSMAHSLESRVPFLDNELVDVALSLSQSEKFSPENGDQTVGKAVLRRAMRDRLPDVVYEKDKQGFTMPTFPFVRDELLSHARSILDDPHIVRKGFVQSSYLTALLDREPRRSLTPHYKMLWKLVALEIWYQMFVLDDATGPQELEYYYT